MEILIDAFGGDNSPQEIIAGTIDALKKQDGFNVGLIGLSDVIEKHLSDYKYDKDRVRIIPATEIISCEEEPTTAIRKKVDSTFNVGFKELKQKPDAVAFVSAGSTGAFLVGATLKLGRVRGINRPALCPILPTIKEGKNVLLLDAGANPDSKSINLCQFALMGSIYAKTLGVGNPKVALLSNGTEDEKGNLLIHETLPLLKQMSEINFVGNIEARDILSGEYDVIVADGFSGNVALKSMEGAISNLFSIIKRSVSSSVSGKLAGLLLKKSFKKIKNKMDYKKHGGAIFIGIEKVVIKAHGSAKRDSFMKSVLQAYEYASKDVVGKIKEKLSQSEQVSE